jgi:hypothetical protein
MHDPREPHLALLKRIFRYVKGTLGSGLHIGTGSIQSLITRDGKFNRSPRGTGMGNALSPFTRRGRIFPVYIPVGENLPHPHPLMEEFPAGNRGSGPHCYLYLPLTLMRIGLPVRTFDTLPSASASSSMATWFPSLPSVRPRCLGPQLKSSSVVGFANF